jgi:hypothetical protein
MARRTKEQEQVAASAFPYERHRELHAWRVVEAAVARLVANGDIEEKTARKYLVGYIVKELEEAGILAEALKTK